VPERIANIIVLTEDVEQRNLIWRYLERCGHLRSSVRFEPVAKGHGGSGEKYVRDHYAEQVRACRSSLGKKASALLIVMVDADNEPTQRRAAQLSDALSARGQDERREDEPIVVLIPKRHVETWIRALLGNLVDEATDYTKAPHRPPTSVEIKNAAAKLYEWTRPGAAIPTTSPPSLASSIPEWQKIPSVR
jgi:hypothetical protein